MFRQQTCFIVGAGASAEFGFPVGSELRNTIAELVNIKFADGIRQTSGDYEITESLRLHAREIDDSGDINPYLHVAWRMAEAAPLALSIDNYLEAHQHDEKAEVVGKLAITKAILDAERNSSLYFDHREMSAPDLRESSQTWLTLFFQMASEGVTKSTVGSIFQNVSFINFNYDRSIEFFLYHALKSYYGLEDSSAKELISSLRIFHPYGTVGGLPFEGGNGVHYGSEKHGSRLLGLSKSIKTFSERIEENTELSTAKEWLRLSSAAVFLGFAYHRQNLELIDTLATSNIRDTLGTSYGISRGDQEVVEKTIPNYLHNSQAAPAHLIPCKSNELLGSNWRRLTA